MWKRLLIFLVALSFIGVGNVWAMSCDDQVSSSINGKGSVAIVPIYAADAGLTTQLEVINTSPDNSVVVKVVFRSAVYSQELLDFFVYLSPNDVWRGEVRVNAAGEVEVYSTDGSVWNPATSACASENSPFEYTLSVPTCEGDTANLGYVEFFGAWATEGEHHCSDLRSLYQDQTDGPWGIGDVLAVRANMIVGEDYIDIPVAHLTNYHPTVKLSIGQETFLGQNADSNTCEVESALALNEIDIPYNDAEGWNTLLVTTFPTKLSYDETEEEVCDGLSEKNSGPFFQQNGLATQNYGVTYTANFFDLEENTVVEQGCEISPCPEETVEALPDEVTLREIDAPFTAGWLRATFGQTTNCTNLAGENVVFSGAPVIPVVAQVSPYGMAVHVPAIEWATVTCGQGAGGAATVINGEVVTCNTNCQDTFANDNSGLLQCAIWQGQTCGDTTLICTLAQQDADLCDNTAVADLCPNVCGGTGGASTQINGVTVTCDTDCNATFAGDIPSIIQCNVWQQENCQE